MEIEAKFAVPDEATYARLQDCGELAGFNVAPGPTVTNRDQYLDTVDGRFLAAGYACRLRAEGDVYIATLKSLGTAGGAIHRRDEREVRMAEAEPDPEQWPDGPARWLASELAAGERLQPLLALQQQRARRNVMDGERLVGEFTADAVEVVLRGEATDGTERYYELEIELKGDGTEADLERLSRELQEGWGLVPEPRSKFERALESLWARYPELKPRGAAGPRPPESPPSPGGAKPAANGKKQARSDAQPSRDEFPPRSEMVLAPDEVAALENYAGSSRRPVARRAKAVLSWAAGLSTRDVASHTGLSAGRVRFWVRSFRERRLGIFARPARMQHGLPQAIEEISPMTDEQAPADDVAPAQLKEGVTETAAVAVAESGIPPEPVMEQPSEAQGQAEALTGASAAPVPPPMSVDDPMSEAGRKLMLLQFQRMCHEEAGTRAGEDPEALHDMRVATRRLRAAYLLFAPYFDEKALGRFNKRLRRTGRLLGEVRDLDVLLGKVERYLEKQNENAALSLAPLLDAWRKKRDKDRERLIKYLDTKGYQEFRDDFAAFLTTPGAGALALPPDQPVAYQVRHVAPRLLLGRYEDVRAYEPLFPNAPLTTYHQLRIACKKLRYALEFFRDVLGDGAGALIKKVTAMQDLLGDLQDATVAEELIAAFLADQVAVHASARHQAPLDGLTTYLATQWATQRELLAKFPVQWTELGGYEFRKGLSLAVAVL
jgi:CHAD domain-containing protein